LLDKVGIINPEKAYKTKPIDFSGGMKQRVVIAIALAANPKILVADEPTTALDVTIQKQILKLITDLKNEFKFTIIFITHDLSVVANIADRIAVMYCGQVIEYGTKDDIFTDPRHPYT
jgi:oligopeptide transport system ATP-binding protein